MLGAFYFDEGPDDIVPVNIKNPYRDRSCMAYMVTTQL